MSSCWDNNDVQEKTLTEHDTAHCTNGIVIPPVTFGSSLPPAVLDPQRKQNNKGISVSETLLMDLPYYHAGMRRGLPASLEVDALNALLQIGRTVHEKAQELDFLWFLLW